MTDLIFWKQDNGREDPFVLCNIDDMTDHTLGMVIRLQAEMGRTRFEFKGGIERGEEASGNFSILSWISEYLDL